MIYIAHRGNIDGRMPEAENHPNHIKYALFEGYDVEIDFWLVDGKIVLGHDEPQHEVDKRFLIHPNIWIHAKNPEAFEMIVGNQLKGFWHTQEDYALTTDGHIWVYPGNQLLKDSIAVLPETVTNYGVSDLQQCFAICSDEVKKFKGLLQ